MIAPRRLPLLLLSLSLVGACSTVALRIDSSARAPVIDGFGAVTMAPPQANAAARRLFEQGMAQVYAFNRPEAIRAFKAALAEDPSCAMCAWGVASQMGPNINNPKRGDVREAAEYTGYALKHMDRATPRERALIEALAVRYGHASMQRELAPLQAEICGADGGGGGKRADPLDIAYAARMREVAALYPDDPDLLTFYVEAEMVATRTDWWDRDTGKPSGRIGELATRIEAALARHPEHVGLNHYMIHAVDAVQVAGRAVPAAERLGKLAPNSPHLLHMPSHTFAHVGRYADATRVNQLAVAAEDAQDAALLQQRFKPVFDWRSHNRNFQWYGAMMEGRAELALSTARAAAAHARGEALHHEYTRALPMLTLVQLQRWDAVLAEPLPSGSKGMADVLGQMARGMAQARSGRTAEAEAALARLTPQAEQLVTQATGTDYNAKLARSLAGMAQAQLRAEIALARGNLAEAVAQQTRAHTAALDAERFEPPRLAGAPGQRLGAMLMQAQRYAEAEQTYRADLAERPANGWALQGLAAALAAQGKQADAQTASRALARSWPLADSSLKANTAN